MAQSGVNYFLSNYSSIFNYEDFWKINFDFKNNGLTINNKSGANPLYSGVVNLGVPIHLASAVLGGYDYLNIVNNSTNVRLSPSTGLWSDNFSLLFLVNFTNFTNMNNSGSILFNCLESGDYNGENIYKGYVLGYNACKQLYFQHYGKTGPEILTSNFKLNNNHSIFCIKNENNLTLGYYDFFNQSVNTNSFFIDSDFLFEPSSGYRLGNYTGNTKLDIPNYINTLYTPYKIDEFLYFTTSLYDYDIQIINSGWIANYVPAYTGSGNILTTGITGYSTGQILLGSGVTGVGITGTGFLTNEYGVSYSGYLTGQLTGNIYGGGVTSLTGIINTPFYNLIDASININSGFVRSFYPNALTYLKKIDYKDYTCLVGETGLIDWLGYNNESSYDSIQEKFKIFTQDEILCWLNGMTVYSGNKFNSGTIYNPNYVLENDYFKTGQYLDSTGFFDRSDTLDYLKLSKINYYNKSFSYNGGGPSILTGVYSGNNTLIFFNGQLLTSGITGNGGNYVISGNNVVFNQSLYNGTTGTLASVIFNNSFINVINNQTFLTTSSGFNENYSLVFLNGQKQKNGDDFIFIGNNNMLLRSGIFEQKPGEMINSFNSEDLFFNII